MDCIFCKIVNKEIDTTIVYEDDVVIAIDDLYPKAPIHKLIIPKKHIATLNDIHEEDVPLIGHMSYVAKQLAIELDIAEQGYRLITNCNAGAGQTVFHIHTHLMGGRALDWPPG